MRAMPGKLSHPPVVEAIASFRLAKPIPCAEPLALPGYAEPLPIYRAPAPGEAPAGGLPDTGAPAGFQYAREDALGALCALVRMTLEGLAFHLLQSPYPGFEALEDEVSGVLPLYLGWAGFETSAPAVAEVSLRNINKISVLPGQSWASLLRGVRAQDGKGLRTERFISQEAFAFPGERCAGKVRATVTKSFLPAAKVDADPFVIVDIEVSSRVTVPLPADAAIQEMRALRGVKNKLFRAALSKEAWSAMK